jgi:Zn-finger nucleic acid-binding protein
MKCPRCPASILAMSERQGIEIDYCPDCRGIWLDRGELDKLIEFAAQAQPSAPAPSQLRSHGHSDFADSDYPAAQSRHGNQGHQGQQGLPQRRKKSWLSDFFD